VTCASFSVVVWAAGSVASMMPGQGSRLRLKAISSPSSEQTRSRRTLIAVDQLDLVSLSLSRSQRQPRRPERARGA